MVSSYTTRNRLNKQATGDNPSSWGAALNSGVFDLTDFAMDGWTTKALTADVTLTSVNGAADEARARCLKLTGTSSWTVTVPAVEKFYLVWNASSATQTIASAGGGASVTLVAGEVVFVITDATLVKRLTLLTMGSTRLQNVTDPTDDQDAATKKYVDDTAFASATLPAQAGNAGKFVKTDGSAASWAALATSDFATFSATATVVRAGTSTAAALTPGDTYAALAEVTITYAASVAPDMATFINAAITLTGNITLANPTNAKPGQTGRIRLIQDGTGSRLLSAVGSWWKRDGGVPVLSTAASAKDYIYYDVVDADEINYTIVKAPS